MRRRKVHRGGKGHREDKKGVLKNSWAVEVWLGAEGIEKG